MLYRVVVWPRKGARIVMDVVARAAYEADAIARLEVAKTHDVASSVVIKMPSSLVKT